MERALRHPGPPGDQEMMWEQGRVEDGCMSSQGWGVRRESGGHEDGPSGPHSCRQKNRPYARPVGEGY
jgi:hypothetical protein